MSMNKTCAISSAISFLISVDMDGECPWHCIKSDYLAFVSQVETKAGASRSDGIAPRNLLTPHSFRMVSFCLIGASFLIGERRWAKSPGLGDF